MKREETQDKTLRDAHIDMALNRLSGRLSALGRAQAADPVPKDLWAAIRDACLKQANEMLEYCDPNENRLAKLVGIAIAIDAHINDLSAGAAERFVDQVLAGQV